MTTIYAVSAAAREIAGEADLTVGDPREERTPEQVEEIIGNLRQYPNDSPYPDNLVYGAAEQFIRDANG